MISNRLFLALCLALAACSSPQPRPAPAPALPLAAQVEAKHAEWVAYVAVQQAQLNKLPWSALVGPWRALDATTVNLERWRDLFVQHPTPENAANYIAQVNAAKGKAQP